MDRRRANAPVLGSTPTDEVEHMSRIRLRLKIVAFDTETELIRPACLAPELVCITWQSPGEAAQIAHHSDPSVEEMIRSWLTGNILIVGHNIAYDLAVLYERFPSLRRLIFDAYAADRVTDTQIRQQLLDIAAGAYKGRFGAGGKWVPHDYTLESLAKRCAGMTLQKDAWRLSYGKFLNTPLSGWLTRAREVQADARVDIERVRELASRSEADRKEHQSVIDALESMIASDPSQCLTYPLDDARATLAVFTAQEKHALYLEDQYRQARAAWAQHLNSAWGLRTDEAGVEILRAEVTADLEEIEAELKEAGLVRPNGTRDTKAAKRAMVEVCAREGLILRRTDAHGESEGKCKDVDGRPVADGADECAEHVSLDGDACEATEDATMVAYAELSKLKKVLGNDVEALAKGVYYPVHTRYGLAETGRATSSKPNIQNWVRERKCRVCKADSKRRESCEACGRTGFKAGARECFIPRPGRVFAQADFPQLELYTLAQCCQTWLGHSELAKALNDGLDPHMAVAAKILGTTYEDAKANSKTAEVKTARGAGKIANFGIPGGLGIDSMVAFAKKAYGQDLTREQAKTLKEHYFATWTEMPAYFARINELCNNDSERAMVETLWTKRYRGNATYCAACNNGFQALGADCAKNAGWLIARAGYVDYESPLYGGRAVAFVHDEFIVEVDDNDKAHDAAYELARLMCVGANVYLPDVPIKVEKMEPLLMRRWSKKAEPRFNEEGRLIPWAA